jgi:hypothetical protein
VGPQVVRDLLRGIGKSTKKNYDNTVSPLLDLGRELGLGELATILASFDVRKEWNRCQKLAKKRSGAAADAEFLRLELYTTYFEKELEVKLYPYLNREKSNALRVASS